MNCKFSTSVWGRCSKLTASVFNLALTFILVGVSVSNTLAQQTTRFQRFKGTSPGYEDGSINKENGAAIDGLNWYKYNYLSFGTLNTYKTKDSRNPFFGEMSIGVISTTNNVWDWDPNHDKYNGVKLFEKMQFGYIKKSGDSCPGQDRCYGEVSSADEAWLMTLLQNGNVGIGTTNPQAGLDIGNWTSWNQPALKLSKSGGSDIRIINDSYGFSLRNFTNTAGPIFNIRDNYDNVRFNVNGNGYVGIGNLAPTKLLEIGTDNSSNTNTLLQVHGGAVFNNDADVNHLTKVRINTNKYVDGTVLTVGGPTYIGTWQAAEANAESSSFVASNYFTKYHLFVEKGVVSEDFVYAAKTSWKDEVFAPDYKLPTLGEVEQFVKENRHLPGIPSEKEVKEKGYSNHELNKALLEKIEHLMLYSIEQEKRIKELEQKLISLDGKLKK